MAPVTFRADLLACRIYAALVARVPDADFVSVAVCAFDAAVVFAQEHKRRNPLTGEPLYPHGELPVDHDPDAPTATSGA